MERKKGARRLCPSGVTSGEPFAQQRPVIVAGDFNQWVPPRRQPQKTAIQFIDYVLEKLPFNVEVIQTECA